MLCVIIFVFRYLRHVSYTLFFSICLLERQQHESYLNRQIFRQKTPFFSRRLYLIKIQVNSDRVPPHKVVCKCSFCECFICTPNAKTVNVFDNVISPQTFIHIPQRKCNNTTMLRLQKTKYFLDIIICTGQVIRARYKPPKLKKSHHVARHGNLNNENKNINKRISISSAFWIKMRFSKRFYQNILSVEFFDHRFRVKQYVYLPLSLLMPCRFYLYCCFYNSLNEHYVKYWNIQDTLVTLQ